MPKNDDAQNTEMVDGQIVYTEPGEPTENGTKPKQTRTRTAPVLNPATAAASQRLMLEFIALSQSDREIVIRDFEKAKADTLNAETLNFWTIATRVIATVDFANLKAVEKTTA